MIVPPTRQRFGRVLTRHNQSTALLKIACIKNLLQNLSGERRVPSAAQVVNHQHPEAYKRVDDLLFFLGRLHAKSSNQLEWGHHADRCAARERRARKSDRQMRLSYAAGSPKADVLGRGIEFLRAFHRHAITRGDPVLIERELSAWLRASDDPLELRTKRPGPPVVLKPDSIGLDAIRTESINERTAPDPRTGQPRAFECRRWNPFPRQIAPARLAAIDLEKRAHPGRCVRVVPALCLHARARRSLMLRTPVTFGSFECLFDRYIDVSFQ